MFVWYKLAYWYAGRLEAGLKQARGRLECCNRFLGLFGLQAGLKQACFVGFCNRFLGLLVCLLEVFEVGMWFETGLLCFEFIV